MKAAPQRPKLGSLVVLREGRDACFTTGGIKDVGAVIKDDGSSVPFQVNVAPFPLSRLSLLECLYQILASPVWHACEAHTLTVT